MEELGRSKFKLAWIVLPTVALIGGLLVYWGISHTGYVILSPKGEENSHQEKAYEKYSFEKLAQRGGIASKIEIIGNKFYYQSEGRKISGEVNIPDISGIAGKLPVVVMARGYVDKEIYKTGIGTHNAAMVFAKNGFITLAPDFSGYGDSDQEDENALGARLIKPVEILDLLASLSSIPQADLSRVYLWGHSNGGQIMLSVVEILGHLTRTVPVIKGVTLWAPVSKPFPYNILYYTDEADDKGKWLRGEIAKFEKDYDVFRYSIDNYYDRIKIPIQLHQGTADEAVPKKWSDELVKNLKDKDKDIKYFVYPGADHNLKPGWDQVVARDVEFFRSLN